MYKRQLFDAAGTLVAAASFSHARTVLRDGMPHRSHELLRTCTARDGAVVGAISKLVGAFCRAHGADDIVTVIDRDWGIGVGWRSIGFETVQTMPPLTMLVGSDGLRRHLIGAGLAHTPLEDESPSCGELGDAIDRPATVGSSRARADGCTPGAGAGEHGVGAARVPSSRLLRAALPAELMRALDTHAADEPLALLAAHGYLAVHDAGVERLVFLVDSTRRQQPGDTHRLWTRSIPSYAPTHYSSNQGVHGLLRRVAAAGAHAHAESAHAYDVARALASGASGTSGTLAALASGALPPADPDDVRGALDSWRAAARASAPDATVSPYIFSAPSAVADGGDSTVEVHARPDGWRTLRVVTGKRHVLQAVVRLDAHGAPVPGAIASEYVRTMAALALAALEAAAPRARAGARAPDAHGGGAPALRCLHLGLGGGVLARLFATLEPRSAHVAVEIDRTIVAALAELGGLALHAHADNAAGECAADACASDDVASRQIEAHVADAASWVAQLAATPHASRARFDAVFVDCFDNSNDCPPSLLTRAFAEHVRAILTPRGVVVHNLHFGASRHQPTVAAAEAAYAHVFGSAVRVDSLDSKPWAGNTLILGTRHGHVAASAGALEASAALAQGRLEAARASDAQCIYDLRARVRGARLLRPQARQGVHLL